MGDAVLPADLVEEDLDRSDREATGEDLAVVGEDLFGHPVALEGLGQEATDRSGGGPDRDARTDAKARVVVDPGEHLALAGITDDIHLPQLHRAPPFPALVGLELLAGSLGLDQVVAHQGPIDGHVREDHLETLSLEVVLQADRAHEGWIRRKVMIRSSTLASI